MAPRGRDHQGGGLLAQALALGGRGEHPQQPRVGGQRHRLGGDADQPVERIVEADPDEPPGASSALPNRTAVPSSRRANTAGGDAVGGGLAVGQPHQDGVVGEAARQRRPADGHQHRQHDGAGRPGMGGPRWPAGRRETARGATQDRAQDDQWIRQRTPRAFGVAGHRPQACRATGSRAPLGLRVGRCLFPDGGRKYKRAIAAGDPAAAGSPAAAGGRAITLRHELVSSCLTVFIGLS